MNPAEKKRLELLACQSVASEINQTAGTDFQPQEAAREPADIVFVSPSRKWPDRDAQVVSTPRDIHHRDDSHNLERMRQNMTAALRARGTRGIFVGLLPDAIAVERGVRPRLLERIADFISGKGRVGDFTVQYDELLELLPDVAEYFHQFFVSYLPDQDWTVVDVAGPGGALPLDGRWICDAINLKLAKYGGPRYVENLMLVIDACGFVTEQQIAAFRNAHPPELLPFAEIWITGSPAGTICLKPRRR